MKKPVLLYRLAGIVSLLFLSLSLWSQSPGGISYQAVAHEGSDILVNEELNIEISVIKGDPENNPVYAESHDISTNDHGLFSLVIGSGSPLTGNFGNINWPSGSHYLGVRYKKASDGIFSDMQTVKIQGVPYAFHAATAAGWRTNADTIVTLSHVSIGAPGPSGSALAVTGSDVASPEPLFEVKREDGVPVFAVYNDGVMVYVDEKNKGVKGGFAVGGYSAVKKGLTNEYLRVTPDSVRIYINDDIAKGVKGGFAVGGYSSSKGFSREFLRVTDDSTRIYLDDPEGKGVKGGFAVGGYSANKAEPYDFMSLTPRNYFIGHRSGTGITSGRFNSFLGYESGRSTTEGSYNVFMGRQSGQFNTTGSNNVLLGNHAGLNNIDGSDNIFIGNQSGLSNENGGYNTYIGFRTGYYGGNQATDPSFNTFVGYEAGFGNRSGDYNTYLGHRAGYSGVNANGSNNVFVGDSAGFANIKGDNNIFIGKSAGSGNVEGDFNVILGSRAGYKNNGTFNVFIGYESGMNNISGADSRFSKYNTFIGYQSGRENTTGWNNLAIGYRAGIANQVATNQFFLGNQSGENLVDGFNNTYVGHLTGRFSENVSENTFIGYQSGYQNIEGTGNTYLGNAAGLKAKGSGNVFIGNRVGWNEEFGNNLLYIDNSSTSDPLIEGNFSSNNLIINGNFGYTGSFLNPSDAGLKRDFLELVDVTEKLKALKGYYFRWNERARNELVVEDEIQIGMIAQEVEQVFPELVHESGSGYKTLDYISFTAVLLQAINEQQQELEHKEAEISELKERLEKVESALGL